MILDFFLHWEQKENVNDREKKRERDTDRERETERVTKKDGQEWLQHIVRNKLRTIRLLSFALALSPLFCIARPTIVTGSHTK